MYKSTSAKEGDKVASATMTDPGSRRMWRDLFILSNLISAFQQMRAITTAVKKHDSTSLDSVSRTLISICHDCDVALISIGRKAFTDKLNLEKIKLKTDAKGRVKVDKNFTCIQFDFPDHRF